MTRRVCMRYTGTLRAISQVELPGERGATRVTRCDPISILGSIWEIGHRYGICGIDLGYDMGNDIIDTDISHSDMGYMSLWWRRPWREAVNTPMRPSL